MNDERKDILSQESEGEKKPSFGAEIYSILRDFAVILAAVTVLFVFVVRFVGVSGSSMYPTLVDKDYMLLLSSFMSNDYKNGDIVVMTVPSFSRDPIVKRIIATEGQTVEIDFETSSVWVDGERLEEPYIFEPTALNYADGMTYPATVPEGCVFVMGDNRNHSADSRYPTIGMVDTRRVMGKVLCILLPGRRTNNRGEIIGGRDLSRIGAVS